jgi:putative hydrolase
MSNVPFGFQPSDPDDQGQDKGPFNMGDLGSALSQLGAMLQGMQSNPNPGAVNWDTATDVARKTIAAHGDPVVSDSQRRGVEEAVRLADLWLDPNTDFPSTGAGARAWSRSQWLEATMPAWKVIITPVAEQVQESMGSMLPGPDELAGELPEELRAMLPEGMPVDLTAMLGPMMGVVKQMGATMFATQAGQGLAALAGEVLGAGDVGLPLTSDGVPTLLPENVAAFGAGLEIEPGEIALYLALREVAHQRLFSHVTWLGPTMRGAVAEYAAGIGLDSGAMTEALRDIDMTNPANLQEALSSGVLAPQDTPEQKAALARLETLLALVEGWVDHVVSAAIDDRLPTAGKLQEAVRRRRAVGGPAEKTFENLVGLQMRPRRLRDAAALWRELERVRGVAGRDAVWAHPDLLPGPADLDDPTSFVTGSAISDDELAALASGEFPTPSASREQASGAEASDEAAAGEDPAGASGASEDDAAAGTSSSTEVASDESSDTGDAQGDQPSGGDSEGTDTAG